MKTYRFVLGLSVILILVSLLLPIYTSTRIPGSIIMWSSILLMLSPAFAITLLLAALPRMPFRWLALVSVILGIGFVGGVLAGQFGLSMLLMYALGAIAVLLAAGLRSRHHGPSVGQST